MPKGAARAADAIEGRQRTAEYVLLNKRTSRDRLAQDEASLAGHEQLATFLAERRLKSSNEPCDQTATKPKPSEDTQKQKKASETSLGDFFESKDPVNEAKDLMKT